MKITTVIGHRPAAMSSDLRAELSVDMLDRSAHGASVAREVGAGPDDDLEVDTEEDDSFAEDDLLGDDDIAENDKHSHELNDNRFRRHHQHPQRGNALVESAAELGHTASRSAAQRTQVDEHSLSDEALLDSFSHEDHSASRSRSSRDFMSAAETTSQSSTRVTLQVFSTYAVNKSGSKQKEEFDHLVDDVNPFDSDKANNKNGTQTHLSNSSIKHLVLQLEHEDDLDNSADDTTPFASSSSGNESGTQNHSSNKSGSKHEDDLDEFMDDANPFDGGNSKNKSGKQNHSQNLSGNGSEAEGLRHSHQSNGDMDQFFDDLDPFNRGNRSKENNDEDDVDKVLGDINENGKQNRSSNKSGSKHEDDLDEFVDDATPFASSSSGNKNGTQNHSSNKSGSKHEDDLDDFVDDVNPFVPSKHEDDIEEFVDDVNPFDSSSSGKKSGKQNHSSNKSGSKHEDDLDKFFDDVNPFDSSSSGKKSGEQNHTHPESHKHEDDLDQFLDDINPFYFGPAQGEHAHHKDHEQNARPERHEKSSQPKESATLPYAATNLSKAPCGNKADTTGSGSLPWDNVREDVANGSAPVTRIKLNFSNMNGSTASPARITNMTDKIIHNLHSDLHVLEDSLDILTRKGNAANETSQEASLDASV